jgi:hypothetical protein
MLFVPHLLIQYATVPRFYTACFTFSTPTAHAYHSSTLSPLAWVSRRSLVKATPTPRGALVLVDGFADAIGSGYDHATHVLTICTVIATHFRLFRMPDTLAVRDVFRNSQSRLTTPLPLTPPRTTHTPITPTTASHVITYNVPFGLETHVLEGRRDG